MTVKPALVRVTLGWSAAWLTAGAAFGQELLYTASFADGTYVASGRLEQWHETSAQPKLNGTAIFDQQKRAQWLMCELPDTTPPPAAVVELFGGDQFPGHVVAFREGTETRQDRWPAHVVVKAEVPIDVSTRPARDQVRVAVSAIRRVVWQRRRADRYTPGTLYYADGREVSFDKLRWGPAGVSVLTKDGPRRAAFGELAELHMPRPNVWEQYYESLAALTPDCTARLMCVETYAGLKATVALGRFRATATSGDLNGWFHLLHPAWSLDPLWIRHRDVHWRRFFAAQQPPLSLVEPRSFSQRWSLSGGREWAADRGATRPTLRNGGRTFGWGFGVQAQCQLEFDLPECVKGFHTRVGLDEAAGRGGCARALVYANRATGDPLFRSPHLVGSSAAVDTGMLALAGPAAGQRSLLLVADAAHQDRPAGADPLDIRDFVDWLDPQLDLDVERLRSAVAARYQQTIPAWQGWSVTPSSGAKLELLNRWHARAQDDGRYRIEAQPRGGTLTIGRRLKLLGEHNFLLICAERFAGDSAPSKLEVRVDGALACEIDVPERHPNSEAEPLLVPLARFQGREARLEIVHRPTGEKSWVYWRNLQLVEHTMATAWVQLKVVEARAESGAKLDVQADHAVVVSGAQAEFDAYTLAADTQLTGITAIRLEALSDAKLPNGGPGRSGAGDFVLSDFRMTAGPTARPAEATPVEFAAVQGDSSRERDRYPASAAIDADPKSGWGMMPRTGQPQYGVFTTGQDVGFAGGTRLTITLAQRGASQACLGKFRLSVTSAARPVPVERPDRVLPLVGANLSK